MARRCGCAGSVCSCYLEGLGNATVTGTGSEADPYQIDVDPAVLQVVDTATLNLTLSGNGSPGTPYVLQGDVLGGGGGGLSTEQIMDFLGGVTTPGAGLIGTGLITATYSDSAVGGAGTITFTTTRSEAYLLDRDNHTGSRSNWQTDYDNVSDAAAAEGNTIRYRSGVWTPEALDTSDFALKSGSVKQFADWSDATPASSGVIVPVWSVGASQYVPTDISLLFAGLTAGRIRNDQRPKYNPDLIVIAEGDPVPPDAGAGGVGAVVWTEAAAPSLIPVSHGTNGGANVVAATGVTKATTEVINVGDWIAIFVGTSGEATLPSTYTVTLAAGAVSGGFSTQTPAGQQTSSAQADWIIGRCTTTIPAGTNITVKANQNRVELAIGILSAGNLDNPAIDKAFEGNGTTGTDLTLDSASSGTLAQADELALFGIVGNTGLPVIRSYEATPGFGWIPAFPQLDVSAAGSSRGIRAWYQVTSSTAALAGHVTVTSSDGNSGAWAMKGITLMGV